MSMGEAVTILSPVDGAVSLASHRVSGDSPSRRDRGEHDANSDTMSPQLPSYTTLESAPPCYSSGRHQRIAGTFGYGKEVYPTAPSAADNETELQAAFFEACQRGDEELVEDLLQAGLYLHSRAEGPEFEGQPPTAIHLAAMHGQYGAALVLLRYGAPVNVHRRGGRRPLHDAAERGDSTMVALLLAHGARPYLRDNHGLEPLHLACRSGCFETIPLLLDAGASIDACDHRLYRPAHYLAQCSGDPSLAAFLIYQGCDVDARTHQGYTPLQLACKYGNDRLLEVLLHQGASLEAEEWQATPLALAVRYGQLGPAHLLLASGLNVNSCCPDTHMTVVHLAAMALPGDIAKPMFALLRTYGAIMNVQDVKGNTPLHLAVATAAQHGKTSSIRRSAIESLLSNGAHANILNHSGHYPLNLASQIPDLELFRLLLSASLSGLFDRHLALIDRYLRKQKGTADSIVFGKMRALLAAALISNTL
ncbi:MAG: hypothetical protein Q9218_004382 [Villophora microphyllina]